MTLREIRIKKLKMSQKELADKLNISVSALSKKELGRRKYMPNEIVIISKLSKVKVTDMEF